MSKTKRPKIKKAKEKPEVAPKKPKLKRLYLWLGAAGFAALLVLAGLVIVLRATERPVTAKLQGNKILPVDKPVTFHLNQDLRVAQAQIKLSPADDFDYHFAKSGFGGTELIVKPKKAFKNNREYKLEVKGLQHIVSRRSVPIQTFSFRTELAPGIASFTPTNGQVGRGVNFKLIATDHQTAAKKFQLTLEPATEVEATFDGKTTWEWKPKTLLRQGLTYKVKVAADHKTLQDGTLYTATEPKIVAATNKSYFYPNEKITVTFDKPMRTDQPGILDFATLPGKGTWENDHTYVFTPEKLERNKSYSYTFKAGFASRDGGEIETNRAFTIATPGPASVVSVSPGGSGVRRNAQIRFGFDQPVDHASAEARFQINPKIPGSLKWENNTLVFTPSSYDWQTTYTATISPGVVATYGVPGTQTASARFTTEVETIKLNIPAYRQALPLSCEAAALRMALAKFGVFSDDFTITQRMGYSPRAKAGDEWDDPYSQFVGDIAGKQWNYTGYGVYAPPVAAAARSFGRSASAYFGVGAGFIAQQIHEGKPVVVWGYNYTPTKFSWHTPGGRTIDAWQGEHTRTVVGVVGRADAPQGFYVTDPSSGGTSYWSAGALMANMNVHGGLSNQAVVVW